MSGNYDSDRVYAILRSQGELSFEAVKASLRNQASLGERRGKKGKQGKQEKKDEDEEQITFNQFLGSFLKYQ